MAERRMLHRKVSVSADLAALDAKYGPRAVLFYTWLTPHLDRWGCAPADPSSLLGMVGPLWREVDDKDVSRWVTWMVRRGLLERVQGPRGEQGVRVLQFHKHQAGTKWDREAQSPYEPAEITQQWTRERGKTADTQAGPGVVPDQVRTRSAQRKGREGTARPSPSPTPSPRAVESAAATPEPEPGAQSPPPDVNGHSRRGDAEPARIDFDELAAMSPTMRAGIARARSTARSAT